MLADEGDDLAVALGCAAVIAPRLVDHAEAVVAVMYLGEAFEQIVGGALGLVELPGLDEIDHRIGGGGQFVVFVVGQGEIGKRREVSQGRAVRRHRWRRGGPGRRVLGEAALLIFLAAAAGAAIISADFGHLGNFHRKEGSLYRELLGDARFYDLLLAFDRDLAAAARRRRCPHCGGAMHAAPFMRKPRGRLIVLDQEHDRRFSFCCAVDGCRSRKTPSSLRFLGRKVYLAIVVVLVGLMQGQATAAQLDRFTTLLGVKRRTVGRWREWWLSAFAASGFWKAACALIMPPVEVCALPASLSQRFAVGLQPAGLSRGDAEDRLVALLRFLEPITGGAAVQVF
jgi:hypothetical protein